MAIRFLLSSNDQITQWLKQFLVRKDPKHQMTLHFSIKLARRRKITKLPNDLNDFLQGKTQNTKWPDVFQSNSPEWRKLLNYPMILRISFTEWPKTPNDHLLSTQTYLNDPNYHMREKTKNTKWPDTFLSNLQEWRKLPSYWMTFTISY